MQKNNIRMIVQGSTEIAKEFAERLEEYCHKLTIDNNDKITTPPIVFLTSDGYGRQTATIQFISHEVENINKSMFDGYQLRKAYDKFVEETQSLTSEALFDFLLKQNF